MISNKCYNKAAMLVQKSHWNSRLGNYMYTTIISVLIPAVGSHHYYNTSQPIVANIVMLENTISFSLAWLLWSQIPRYQGEFHQKTMAVRFLITVSPIDETSLPLNAYLQLMA